MGSTNLKAVLSIIKVLPFFLEHQLSSATFSLVVSFGILSALAISTIFIFSISILSLL